MKRGIGTVEVAECCLSWKVENLAHLIPEFSYYSPEFSLGAVGGDGKWKMLLSAPLDEEFVTIELKDTRYNHSNTVRYQVSLVKDGLFILHCEPRIHRIQYQPIDWEDMCEPHHLNNGQLEVHVLFWERGTARHVCPHFTVGIESELPTYDPHSYIFQKLYQDRLHADVTVKVEDQHFKVHRVVFALRSRVFDSMFRQDVSESNTGSIHLTDTNLAMFSALDEYMYTGRVTNLDKIAADLLNLADKYELDRLKQLCEGTLIRAISESTVLEYLALANLNRASWLKNAALKFFKNHEQTLLAQDGWATFQAEQPQLVTELFSYVLPTETTK